MVPLCLLHHPDDELRLSPRVRHPIPGRGGCQADLQGRVFSGRFRMVDQVVSEKESIPVVGKLALDHVNVVRARAGPLIPLDKPGGVWWAVVPVRRPTSTS